MAGLLGALFFGSALIAGGENQRANAKARGFAEANYERTGDPIQPMGDKLVYMPTGEVMQRLEDGYHDRRVYFKGVKTGFVYDPELDEINRKTAEVCNEILKAKENGVRFIKLEFPHNWCDVGAKRQYINKSEHENDFKYVDDTYKDCTQYGRMQKDTNIIIWDLYNDYFYSTYLSNDEVERVRVNGNDMYNYKYFRKPEVNKNKCYRVINICNTLDWHSALMFLEEVILDDKSADIFWDICIDKDVKTYEFPKGFSMADIQKIRQNVFRDKSRPSRNIRTGKYVN